jgi:hypothetical protein
MIEQRGVDYAADRRDVVDEAVTRIDQLDFGYLVEGPRKGCACVTAADNDDSLHHALRARRACLLVSWLGTPRRTY